MRSLRVSLIGIGILALLVVYETIANEGEENVSPLTSTELRWYLPTEDDCVLFVREFGNGSPVVVLHGGPGHSHDVLLGAFDTHYSQNRFVFYDQRGTLYSPCDAEKVSFESNVQDLEALREELKVKKLTLIAYSAGALLAMGYIDKYPDQVKNAILVGAPAFRHPGNDELELGDPVIQDPEIDELIRQKAFRQMKIEGLSDVTDFESLRALPARERSIAANIFFAANFLHDVRRWRSLRGGGIFHNPETESKVAATLPEKWDFSNALKKFDGRLTVINGKSEHRVNLQLWHGIHREIPDLVYRELDDAGHALWIDQPRQFDDAIRKALDPVE